ASQFCYFSVDGDRDDVVDPEDAAGVLHRLGADVEAEVGGRAVPLAVVRAGPVLAAQDVLRMEDELLPAGRRFQLERLLVALARGVREAQLDPGERAGLEPDLKLLEVAALEHAQVAPGPEGGAAAGEIRLEPVGPFPAVGDVGVEEDASLGAGELLAAHVLPRRGILFEVVE